MIIEKKIFVKKKILVLFTLKNRYNCSDRNKKLMLCFYKKIYTVFTIKSLKRFFLVNKKQINFNSFKSYIK